MNNRRDFLRASSTAALTVALIGSESQQAAAATHQQPNIHRQEDSFQLSIGDDVLHAKALSPGILRLDLLANGISDPHTPVLDPGATFPGAPKASVETDTHSIRLKTTEFQLLVHRDSSQITLFDRAGTILLSQTGTQRMLVNPQNQGATGVTFGRDKKANFYGIHNSAEWTNPKVPVLKNGQGVPNGTYKVEASAEGGGGAPFAWTTSGCGILVDSDGGYFHINDDEISFYYGNPKPEDYGRNYFRPNSLTVFIFVGPPKTIFQSLAMVSGKMPLFPKWAYGFTNSQWGTDQHLLRHYLETYRARDIPIDNFTLDFDWKDWGASHFGEFRWNPVKYSQALLPGENPDALINWTRNLECKITGIMKPRIIISTVKGKLEPMTTQGASAKKLGIFLPGEKPFADYFSELMSLDLDFYKPLCRQWYWHATWVHQCMEHGIAGFWNDEADQGNTGNFQFLHMQQSLYDGQRGVRPNKRVWSINRNFYLGSQRYAYATWSGDISTGFHVMREQTLAMINTITMGQMRWAQDTGGFNGHPTPEVYTRWFQFTAVCPTLRTHCTNGERRQPWVFGDQACETVKQAIRQRYTWFFYTYALEHAACAQTGIGIVRPLIFDYPHDPHVISMVDQWMFGDWILCAPVLEELGNQKGQSTTRRIYLPAGEWTDYFRGDRYTGGQWINYTLNTDSWMDWPLFIKQGAIIPAAEPVRAIHTANPEMVYIDIHPTSAATSGLFYDDDGTTYGYEKNEFHRQQITVKADGQRTVVTVSPSSGTYQSSVKHFILRVHGNAAASVTVNSSPAHEVDQWTQFAHATVSWVTDIDVAGPVTLIKIPCGPRTEVILHGTKDVTKRSEVFRAAQASLSGPTPQERPVINSNDKGESWIAGLDAIAMAATFYLRRRRAGKYHAVFQVNNPSILDTQSANIYINGRFYKTLKIPPARKSQPWISLQVHLQLAAGNNTVMIRHDTGTTGKLRLNTIEIPWNPL